MATQDDFIRTALRVPPDLHKAIHEAASSANRTFNAEIVARLQASFNLEPGITDAKRVELVQLVNAAVNEQIGRITASLTLPMATVQATGGPSTSPAQAPQKRVAPPLKKH